MIKNGIFNDKFTKNHQFFKLKGNFYLIFYQYKEVTQ
jgi:hypothetical protein